jgi:hypothetical protein
MLILGYSVPQVKAFFLHPRCSHRGNASMNWGTSATVEQETIRAVVQAYADGKVELPKPRAIEVDDNGKIKGGTVYSAPSFQRYKGDFNAIKNAYNAESIARFLGWMCGEQVSLRS